MLEFKKVKDEYFFIKESRKFFTPNGYPLIVYTKKHAEIIIRDIYNKNIQKDQNSILNLTLFSCNLSENDRKDLRNKIIKILKYDYVLFRNFSDDSIVKKMNLEFSPFIKKFSDTFGINLKLNKNILLNSEISITSKFKDYLKKLKNSEITVLYKLSNITNSIILSFFFMKKKISCKRLFKLVNIEYNYQQKRWGVLEEHKSNNVFLEDAFENINYFLKNMA